MEVKKICVLGTGIRGRQIAQHTAMCGYKVSFVSARGNAEALQQGLDAIRENLKKFFLDKGKMTHDEMNAVLSRIKSYTDLKEGVKGVQVVIENVLENLELKQKVFKELDELCAPETILASDSAGLMITAIGTLTRRQDRVIGMHFFVPVSIMKLIEIVRGVKTSDETHQVIKELSAKLGKETITANDSPGYVVSRLFLVLINEAAKLVYEGVCTPEDVDKGCQLGLGHAMGPLRACDLGNGLAHAPYTMNHLRDILGDEYRACPLITKKHLAGETGEPAGKGFYDYTQQQ